MTREELDSPPSACVWATVEVLRSVERYEIGLHPQGFLRPLVAHRVTAIEAELQAGTATFGPIIAGRLPDGTLVEIDGGHRREACLRAGVGWWIVIYDIETLDEARRMFLVSKVGRRTRRRQPGATS